MGYGGIIKTVARVAIPVAVGIATHGNPWAIAIASGMTTKATGGSFKESLMAAGTSYIGSSVTQSFNQAASAGLGQQIANGTATYVPAHATATGMQEAFVRSATGDILASGAAATAANATVASSASAGLFDTLSNDLASKTDQLVGGQSVFTPADTSSGFGGFVEGGKEVLRSPFSALQNAGETALDFANVANPSQYVNLTSALAGAAPQTLTGSLLGGVTTMTLNQALLTNNIPALESAGFSPNQIQLLQQEARNALSQGKYDEFIASVPNPGLSDEEFGQVIASGIERRNIELGGDLTQEQFDTGFSNLSGQGILDQETDLRKQGFTNTLNQSFTGDAFDNIDDDIINSIVTERSGPAQKQISNFAARGNLNPIGGKSANTFLADQTESATQKVRDVGAGVLGQNQQDVDTIKSTAQSGIEGYKLGDDLFNVTPFAEQRQSLVDERQGSLGSDISSAVGSEPLFDVSGALQAGGRSQGVVSGKNQNSSFLDAIAAREQSGNRQRRGLGTRGSGAF